MQPMKRKRRMVTTFKDREANLLDVLATLGRGWHSRQEIADFLGKNKLSPTDATVLDAMADKGLIEKGLAATSLPTVQHWQYRLKP